MNIPETTKEQYEECLSLTRKYAPEALPRGWKKAYNPQSPEFSGQLWYLSGDGLPDFGK